MKILVTGGAGYVGVSLVEKLSHLPEVEEIVVYDNLSAGSHGLFLYANVGKVPIRFVQAELLDTRKLKEALTGIDLVYHLAAVVKTPFSSFDPHYFEQTNHWGCAELARLLDESEVKRLIYTSSAAVYGSSEGKFDDDSSPSPQTYYAVSKLRGEHQIDRLSSKLQVYKLRLGNVYGVNPSMRFDAVVNKFLLHANFQQKIQIHGDGSQKRTFIGVEHLSRALEKMATARIEAGTYNLSAHNLSVIEIADQLQELVPGLEFIYMDQHIKFPNLQVELDNRFSKELGLKIPSFREDLEAALGRLSF